jgi:Uma2 family endonuclease
MASPGMELPIAELGPAIERLDVDQFHRMIESGILREGAPIELIDGILVRKDNSDLGGKPMTHGPKHALCLQRIRELDARLRPHGCHLRQQLPVTLADRCEPEPDAVVVRGRIEDYETRHPAPEDCLVCIEVADRSLEYDRTIKGPMYAAAGLPAYMVVNLRQSQVEVYRSPVPSEARYAERTDCPSGAVVNVELPGGASLEIRVEEWLP